MDNQEGNNGPIHQSQGMDPKTVAMIAYLTFIGTIIAIVVNNNNKDEFASFHIRQALGLVLCMVVLQVLWLIPFLGWIAFPIVALIVFILWIIGFMAALNGQEKVVPILGEKFQEWFSGI